MFAQAKINKLDTVVTSIDQNVFGLDITVNETLEVNVIDCFENLNHVNSGLMLRETSVFLNFVVELTSTTDFKNHTHSVLIFEIFIELCNVWMIKLFVNFDFIL